MAERTRSLFAGVNVGAARRVVPIAFALRKTLAQGYDVPSLRADLLAGLVVGIVALPLSMALAIAVGVPPQHGLYTAVVAGAVVAALGGSKFQVTGPTAAFVVILAPIVAKYGLSGLLTAGLMAGVILFAMGVARLGHLIEFIPHPVTTGFTAGIATVLATLQLKDTFGLPIEKMPDSYVEKIGALWDKRAAASGVELGVTVLTVLLIVLVPRLTKRVPAPLVAIVSVTLLVTLVVHFVPSVHVATIGTRFHAVVHGREVPGIPNAPPLPMIPWGEGGLSFSLVRELFPSALAIAILGAIESLLSAVIADGVTGKRHDSDSELVALGIGNIVAPFFGGIPATGALARTALNIRNGARSPVAAIVHAFVVLLAILIIAPLVAYVPMASFAAMLLVVAWNMSELRHFVHTVKVAPRADVFVLATCYLLTVVFDMVVAVGVGVVLAALLFMKRMAELTETKLLGADNTADTSRVLPKGVAVYEIAGPLFFGAAERAMGLLDRVGADSRIVVLGLGRVPVIDATGLVALESALERLRRSKKLVIIAGPLPEPRKIFDRANLEGLHEHVFLAKDLDEAIQLAADLIVLSPESRKSVVPPPLEGVAP